MMRFTLGIAAPFLLALLAACGSSSGGSHGTSSTTGAGGAGGTTNTGGTTSTGGSTSTGGAGGMTSTGSGDAGETGDAGAGEAGPSCSVGCTPGECMLVSDCAALGGHSSTPGYCPGPANVECCTAGGSVSDNPAVPSGWMLMTQAMVTQQMTDWAVMILNDPTDYPMFSTAQMTFGTQLVMARVEWHPPDFQNCAIHRGVTLYVPA